MINLKLSLYNLNKHPQIFMNDLGILYTGSESCPLGDCWFFFDCKNVPEILPEQLEITTYQKEFTDKFLNGLNGKTD